MATFTSISERQNGADAFSISSDLLRAYEEWEKTHAMMNSTMNSTPRQGRDYLNHAKTLLQFITVIADFHPAAKAVVATFQSVVLFESIRRENEIRVTAVFLAQADTLRFLVDVARLARRHNGGLSWEQLHSITNTLHRIETDIKTCANDIDCYYKELRLVKFWKAQEWKERMLKYITDFGQHRTSLHEALAIQMASGLCDISTQVNVLVSKMDLLLSNVFEPTFNWEKSLAKKTRQLGTSWIEDTEALKNLISISEETEPFKPLVSASKKPSDSDVVKVPSELVQKIKMGLTVSLDKLCEQNAEMFTLKLKMHTTRLQEDIANSAHHIVKSLSGPYDRLQNADLRELWKEMNWIFCVDNKLFASALHEYYRDKFSTNSLTVQNDSSRSPQIGHSVEIEFEFEETRNDAKSEETRENVDSSSLDETDTRKTQAALPPRSHASHTDSWALQYLSQHGASIASHIDSDRSGYIRIGEANTFTSTIPEGWTLPQWCAYQAAGWPYEERVYRKRMQTLAFKTAELQGYVLPENRRYMALVAVVIARELEQLWRSPRQTTKNPKIVEELRSLVHKKILDQDEKTRSRLASLKWTIEDESSIRLLYGAAREVEWYTHQFCTIVLERIYTLMQVGCTEYLDMRELYDAIFSIVVLKGMIIKRVSWLKNFYEENIITTPIGRIDVLNFHHGIWYYIGGQPLYRDDPRIAPPGRAYEMIEIKDYLSDISIIDDFPIQFLPNRSPLAVSLKYETWNEYTKKLKPEDIPKTPPMWDAPESDVGTHPASWTCSEMRKFPYFNVTCDKCKKDSVHEPRYVCLECMNFDLCTECFIDLPEASLCFGNHNPEHGAIRFALGTSNFQLRWMVQEAKEILERNRETLFYSQKPYDSDDSGSAFTEEASDAEESEKHAENGEPSTNVESALTAESTTSSDLPVPSEADEAIAGTVDTDIDQASIPAADLPENTDGAISEPKSPLSVENDPMATLTELPQAGDDANVDANAGILATQSSIPAESPPTNDEATSSELDSSTTPPGPVEVGEAPLDSSAKMDSDVLKDWECGRCSKSVQDEQTLRRCFGHSCRDYLVCNSCVKDYTDKPNDEHKWWHTLLVFRRSFILTEPPLHGDDAKKEDTTANANAHLSTLETNLGVRCDSIEAKLNATHMALEEKMISSNAERAERLDALGAKLQERLDGLETKMIADNATFGDVLEAKVTSSNARLEDGLEAKMIVSDAKLGERLDGLEVKMSNLEGHMEDLKKLLGVLVGQVPASV